MHRLIKYLVVRLYEIIKQQKMHPLFSRLDTALWPNVTNTMKSLSFEWES